MIFKIDPLQDPRWPALVERHPLASIFHTRGWLEAIRRTYGFKVTAYTSSAPSSELSNGLLFCRVRGFFGASGLVSLPFSDYCEPLCESPEELDFLMGCLQAEMQHRDWKYLEMRPFRWTLNGKADAAGFHPVKSHTLRWFDLSSGPDQMFRRLDGSVQRSIQSAQQSDVTMQSGRSEELLKAFYRQMILAGGREGLPLNPSGWFRNLVDCLGESLEIRVAFRSKVPVAASMSLRFRDKTLRKYSCWDGRYRDSDAASALLWNELVEAKSSGASEYHLGRSGSSLTCVPALDRGWGAGQTELVSWGFPAPRAAFLNRRVNCRTGQSLLGLVSQPLIKAATRVMYPHLG